MKKRWIFMIISVLILSMLTGCKLNSEKNAKETQVDKQSEQVEAKADDGNLDNPVEIETYKSTFTYDKIPQRVVSLNYEATQLLVALGLEDKIVGVATAEGEVGDCLEEYQETLSKLKIITEGTPTLEVLLKSNPDFVFGTCWSFMECGVAEPKDFIENNIKYYAMLGTYSENASVSDTYHDIECLGKIFKVEDRAEELIEKLKKREDNYRVDKPEGSAIKVFAYDSGDKEAYTAGRGLETDIIEIAGGKNIFGDIEKSFAPVSWEQIALRNPDIIIIHDYNTGDTNGSLEDKINELKSNPALQEVEAIKNDRFVVVKLVEVFPGLQMFDAVDKIHEAIIEYSKSK